MVKNTLEKKKSFFGNLLLLLEDVSFLCVYVGGFKKSGCTEKTIDLQLKNTIEKEMLFGILLFT